MSRIYLGAIGCARGVFASGMREAGALSPEETSKAAAFGLPAARRRFIAGRWLARTMLSGLMNCPAAEIPISLPSNGRPALGAGSPWSFNISHSGDVVACAVADVPVGVDVERVNSHRDMLGIARECFHPSEVEEVEARLFAGMQGEAAERFTVYWTLKEAYMKRLGRGLGSMREAPPFRLEADRGTDAGKDEASWYCLGIPSRVAPPSPYVLSLSAGVGGETEPFGSPELHLMFLLAEDSQSFLLFRSGSAERLEERGQTK